MHLDFGLKLPQCEPWTEGLMELKLAHVRKSRVSLYSSTTTAGSNRADETDLSVAAGVQDGALPDDDEAWPSRSWSIEYE
jgi:hypothetical protein